MDENKNPFNAEDETIKTETDVTGESLNDYIESETTANADENANEETVEEVKEEQNEPTEQSTEDKLEELNNKYLRLAADFDNFRKRTAQEKQDLLKYGASEVLRKILSVLDTFDRAKDSLKDIDNCQTVKDSYELAYKQLTDTLKKVGMEEIEALGKEFNPSEHEAVTQIPTDEYEADHVAAVVQKGYKLADKVLRPALVGVAKKKENE